MECIHFSPDLLPNLTRLVNMHLPRQTPCWDMTESQVATSIDLASSLWNYHYPNEHWEFELQTLCMVENGNLLSAVQWGFPSGQVKRNTCQLFWAFSKPDREDSLQLLFQIVEAKATAVGCNKITTGRFGFGVGWPGISSVWPHLIHGFQLAGYETRQRWVVLTHPLPLSAVTIPGILESTVTSWQENSVASEWDLNLHIDGALMGECSAWGIPANFTGCKGFEAWITIEYVGVEAKYQRQGLGRWLLAEQLRRQALRGIKHAILWTAKDNQPMRCLAESMGFQIVNQSWEFEKACGLSSHN